jgi:hypothetical protein
MNGTAIEKKNHLNEEKPFIKGATINSERRTLNTDIEILS